MRQLGPRRVTCLRSHWDSEAESGLDLKACFLCQDIFCWLLLSPFQQGGEWRSRITEAWMLCELVGGVCGFAFFGNGELTPKLVSPWVFNSAKLDFPKKWMRSVRLKRLLCMVKKRYINSTVRPHNPTVREIIITFQRTRRYTGLVSVRIWLCFLVYFSVPASLALVWLILPIFLANLEIF